MVFSKEESKRKLCIKYSWDIFARSATLNSACHTNCWKTHVSVAPGVGAKIGYKMCL